MVIYQQKDRQIHGLYLSSAGNDANIHLTNIGGIIVGIYSSLSREVFVEVALFHSLFWRSNSSSSPPTEKKRQRSARPTKVDEDRRSTERTTMFHNLQQRRGHHNPD